MAQPPNRKIHPISLPKYFEKSRAMSQAANAKGIAKMHRVPCKRLVSVRTALGNLTFAMTRTDRRA